MNPTTSNTALENKLRLSELPPDDPALRPAEGLEPKKRHRRTRAEIEAAERAAGGVSLQPAGQTFDDSGWELMAGLVKGYFDMQGRKFAIPEYPVNKYEDFSRNLMKLSNYFMGKYAKPIYFLATTTAVQGFALISERNAAMKSAPKPIEIQPDKPQVVEPEKKRPTIIFDVPDNRKDKPTAA